MRSWDTLHPRQATSGREGGRVEAEGEEGEEGGQRKEGGEWEGRRAKLQWVCTEYRKHFYIYFQHGGLEGVSISEADYNS